MSKSKVLLRRVIAFAGALIITFNIVAAPQRARAVALTASVVASVAAIMTACGVSYWAATQTDAIEYLGGKIDDYLGSLETVPQSYEDWLGIDAASQLFEVVAGGVMRFSSGVANKVLDFVRWFNEQEGVVSGGSAVGELGGLGAYSFEDQGVSGTVSLSYADDDTIIFTLTNVCGTSSYYAGRPRGIVFDDAVATGRVTATLVALSSSYERKFYVGMSEGLYSKTVYDIPASVGSSSTAIVSGSENHLCLGFYVVERPWSGTFALRISGDAGDIISPPAAYITPSATVAVPEDLTDDESFNVAPSVPLTQGMTVDQAADAVLDGVASEDGLTTDGETVEGAAAGWGWLADLLERIREAVQGTQEQTAPAEYEAIDSYSLDLTSFFPFCLPWDIHRGLSLLVADPVAPSINWTVPLPGGGTYTLALDLSDYDAVAQVARTMELLAFVVALAVATKKLIKW